MIVAETEAARPAPGAAGAEEEEPVMRLFDTHAHYDSGAFNSDRLETLAAMPEQGAVSYTHLPMATPCTGLRSTR